MGWWKSFGNRQLVAIVQHCEYNLCHWILHLRKFKMANFMTYILYNLKLFGKQIAWQSYLEAKCYAGKWPIRIILIQLFLTFWFSDVYKVITWYHAMQALDMILSNSTLRTNFVNKSSNETHNRIGNVIILWIFKPTFCIIALSYTSCNTKKVKGRNLTND